MTKFRLSLRDITCISWLCAITPCFLFIRTTVKTKCHFCLWSLLLCMVSLGHSFWSTTCRLSVILTSKILQCMDVLLYVKTCTKKTNLVLWKYLPGTRWSWLWNYHVTLIITGHWMSLYLCQHVGWICMYKTCSCVPVLLLTANQTRPHSNINLDYLENKIPDWDF